MITIDTRTREVNIPEEDAIFGVMNDQDSEIRRFKMDRFTPSGVDLADYSFRINYTMDNYVLRYQVKDAVSSDTDIQFSWTVGQYATAKAGRLSFVVCAAIFDEEGNVSNEWNSTIGYGRILNGLEPTIDDDDVAPEVLVRDLMSYVDRSENAAERAEAARAFITGVIENPDSLIVDKSLTIPGAVADSASVGAAIQNSEKQLSASIDSLYSAVEKNAPKTTRKNNQIIVQEFINVAKSYHNLRLNDTGKPIFVYGNNTCLTTAYKETNEINCSTYVGLALRGIRIEDSPYAKFISGSGDTETSDEWNEAGNPDDDDHEVHGTYNPYAIKAKEYPWTINPFDWENKLVDNVYPVEKASQLGQWMLERGQNIDISDGKFLNVEPGDIIFWAKTDNGVYRQPNRFMHISHVAICSRKEEAPTNDTSFPSRYPYKHMILEVTTSEYVVMHRCLEKIRPTEVVLVCRPDLGALTVDGYGSLAKHQIYDLNNAFYEGTYYLTSEVKNGLPDNVATGSKHTLIVEKSMTTIGKVYGLIQRLINTDDNIEYRRVQYCYSHEPNNTSWSEWRILDGGNLLFELFSYTTFQEYLNHFPSGTHLSGYIASASPLYAQKPIDANGLYTLDVSATPLGTKFGRLVCTTTSSIHRMFYTRVTSDGIDTWSEVKFV